jgi:L,D-transpeptidase-like protein
MYQQPVIVAAQPARDLGGGFIEFLFGERERNVAPWPYALPPQQSAPSIYANTQPTAPMFEWQRPDLPMDPQFLPQEVRYGGKEAPGTIVVDTPSHFLYLVEEGGRARRYGIGVGRPGFTWSGEHKVTAKKEWPDWIAGGDAAAPPNLPRYMPGGPENPLGARALYLGSTLTHPRLERAMDDRAQCVVRLHPHAQRGRDRPLRAREGRRAGDCVVGWPSPVIARSADSPISDWIVSIRSQ